MGIVIYLMRVLIRELVLGWVSLTGRVVLERDGDQVMKRGF